MRMETFIRKHYGPAVHNALESQHNSIRVAETASGRVVGFMSITWRQVFRLAGEVGVVEELFIHPQFRRLGIAYQLWLNAVSELRSSGVQTAEVVSSLAHPGQRQYARKIGLEWYASIHRVQI